MTNATRFIAEVRERLSRATQERHKYIFEHLKNCTDDDAELYSFAPTDLTKLTNALDLILTELTKDPTRNKELLKKVEDLFDGTHN